MLGGTLVSQKAQQEMNQHLGLVPSFYKAFPDSAADSLWAFQRDFELGETVIPNKYKELIGLGVSAATRCRYCTLFHTEAAKLFGASPAEIAEANTMASLSMAFSTFLNGQRLDEGKFQKETEAIVAHVRRTMNAS